MQDTHHDTHDAAQNYNKNLQLMDRLTSFGAAVKGDMTYFGIISGAWCDLFNAIDRCWLDILCHCRWRMGFLLWHGSFSLLKHFPGIVFSPFHQRRSLLQVNKRPGMRADRISEQWYYTSSHIWTYMHTYELIYEHICTHMNIYKHIWTHIWATWVMYVHSNTKPIQTLLMWLPPRKFV